MFYCTGPAAHGHVSRWAQPAQAAPGTGVAADDGAEPPNTPGSGTSGYQAAPPIPEPVPDPAAERARQLIADGNKAWAAAAEVRKRWVAQLLWRRTAPKEVIRFVARQLFAMPDALRRGLPAAAGRVVFLELAGKPLEAVLRDCDTAPIARMPLLALAPIAIAYEGEMAGDGDRRNTWRTDAWAPCSRKDAAMWLTFLAGLGYPLSAIEQAVADGVPYTGDKAPDSPDAASAGARSEPDGSAGTDGPDPGDAGSGDPESEVTGTGAADLPGQPGEYPGDAAA